MGERSLFESIWNALSLHILLSDTGNNLRNIDKRSLRSRRHHSFDGVCLVQGTLCRFTGMITSRVQNLVHELFKGFHHGSSGLNLEISLLSKLTLTDQIQNLQFCLVDRCLDLFHRFHIGHCITGTDTKGGLQDPMVNQLLNLVHKPSCFFMTLVQPCCVNETVHTLSNCFLVNNPLYQFPLQYCHLIVVGIESVGQALAVIPNGWPCVCFRMQIDLRQNHSEKLFSGP
mmetsp:Transcript_4213/g.8712  ORF Transcript_4213/g.8712 Transcript_4213/m.8712 type:complete len:229 (-) Transcript_4213:118-804(-)